MFVSGQDIFAKLPLDVHFLGSSVLGSIQKSSNRQKIRGRWQFARSPLVLSSSCILPILHSMLWRQDRNDLIASKQPIKVSLNKRNNVISWIEADPLTQIDRFVILKMFISWRDLRAKPIGKKTSRIVLLGLMAESAWKDNKFSSQKFTRIVGQSDKHTARNSWDRGDHSARAKGSERGRAGALGALVVRPVHWFWAG